MRRAVLVVDQIPDPIGIVALVGDDLGAGGKIIEQEFGHGLVVHLPGRQFDLNRQAVADDP